MKQHQLFGFRVKTKKELAVALFSLANFLGGSLMIGQAFGETGFSFMYVVAGLLLIVILYPVAIYTLEN